MKHALQIDVNTWRDFTKVMKIASGEDWLYRGQEDADWGLCSSLDRELDSEYGHDYFVKSSGVLKSCGHKFPMPTAERSAIQSFRALARGTDIDSLDDVNTLAAMQHYGAKTRLLDFSTSLFVALFFAYEKKITHKERAIYAIRYRDVLDGSGLVESFLRKKEKELEKANCDPEDVSFWRDRIRRAMGFAAVELREFVFDKANSNIVKRSSTPGIIPLYMQGTNARMAAQAGAFLMPTTFKPFSENLVSCLDLGTEDEILHPSKRVTNMSHDRCESLPPDVSLIKLVFSPVLENDAWNILDQANVTARTIYPDLVGIAKSIRYSDKILGFDM